MCQPGSPGTQQRVQSAVQHLLDFNRPTTITGLTVNWGGVRKDETQMFPICVCVCVCVSVCVCVCVRGVCVTVGQHVRGAPIAVNGGPSTYNGQAQVSTE
jgi:hypothetical protein